MLNSSKLEINNNECKINIPTKIVGIDLGIKDLIVRSDGIVVGNKKIEDLSIRKLECPNCLNLNDRDYNASVNIMFECLKLYMKNDLELQVK